MLPKELQLTLDDKTPALLLYSYRGVSTDTKPTALPSGGTLPSGAEFYERNTGKWFDWDGTYWTYRIPAEDPTQQLLRRLIDATNMVHREILALRMGFIETEMCREVTDTDLNSAIAAWASLP